MTANGSQAKPNGRAAVMEAVIDAAQELYVGRSPDEVSVRELAERAGVSHALVHHYFGPKRELLRAVLERSAETIDADVDWTTSAEDVAVRTFESALEHPDYVRAILRNSIDGLEPELLERGYPTVDGLIKLILEPPLEAPEELPHCDPHVVAAVVVALNYGWIATEGWLLRSAGLDDRDPEEVKAEVACVIRTLVRMVQSPSAPVRATPHGGRPSVVPSPRARLYFRFNRIAHSASTGSSRGQSQPQRVGDGGNPTRDASNLAPEPPGRTDVTLSPRTTSAQRTYK